MNKAINNWQRRWHPLLKQWVLIAATSGNRPWSGAMTTVQLDVIPQHDPDCYLCPEVARANGETNPNYRGTYSFDNDFPSLSNQSPDEAADNIEFLTTAKAAGRCRVLCWSERHDLRLASLGKEQLTAAFELCQREYKLLSNDPDVQYVVIFENKGKEVGMSNPHPHGQAYAMSFVTDTATRLRDAQTEYVNKHGSRLLQDMLDDAHVRQELVIERSDSFSVLVPFAARFPFETWIVPHRHVTSLVGLTKTELADLAEIYQRQLRRYDALFLRETPNLTMFHSAPCDNQPNSANSCFHMAMQPPLLSPERLKYLAGWESAAGNVTNPVQPEFAAKQLRGVRA